MGMISSFIFLIFCVLTLNIEAAPRVGLDEADHLFVNRSQSHYSRYIDFSVGFPSSQSDGSGAYNFLTDTLGGCKELDKENCDYSTLAKGIMSVNYFLGPSSFSNYLDHSFQLVLTQYDASEDPLRLSWMFMSSFPEASVGFPLYFIAGAGAGSFYLQGGQDTAFGLIDWKLGLGGKFFVLPGAENLGLSFELSRAWHLSSGFDMHSATYIQLGLSYRL